MVALALAGSVVGFVLGLRFKVLVLLPIEVAALAAAAFMAVLVEVSWVTAFIGFVVFSVSSQLSYGMSLAMPVLWRSRLA